MFNATWQVRQNFLNIPQTSPIFAELIIEIFYRTLIICSHHECYGDATEAVPGLCHQSADSSERIQQDAVRQTDPG